MIAQLTQTLYYNLHREEWNHYRPSQSTYTVDYITLRKGSLLKVLSTPEELKEYGFEENGYPVIVVSRDGYWIGAESLEELKHSSVLRVIE